MTGSTRPVSSCLGSMPDTIAGARISSPESSATPVATPSTVVTAATRAPGPDLRPGRPSRRRQRLGQRGRAALGEHGLARRAAVVARGVGEQHRRRPRGPRPHRRVPDAPPGQSSPGSPRSRTTRPRSRRRPSASTRRIVRPSALPRPRNARPSRRPSSASPKPGVLDVGRRLVAEVGQEARQRPDAPVELHERRRVVVRPGAQGVDGLAEVAPQRHRPPVGLGREHAHLGRHERQAVAR